MSRRRISWWRVAAGVVPGLILLYCLIGIGLTGPIVVTPGKLELELDLSPERLEADVRMLSETIGPRGWRHPENLRRASEWIAAELRAGGLRVEFQEYAVDGATYRNVVAFQPGTDASKRSVVVGAHYDAYAEFPGADDNASGVAVLLELVRTLPQRFPARNRYFVAFATEEPPFFGTEDMGSYRFAERLVAQGERLDWMISLDMVGYFSDAPGSQKVPSRWIAPLYPDRGNFLGVIGDWDQGETILQVKTGLARSPGLPVHSFRAPARWAPTDLSDHRSFNALGLPAVQVTDTAFMRYDHYHRATDTADRLDYERMALVVRALHTLLWEP